MITYNEMEELDYQHMEESELRRALLDLEELYNLICAEEPAEDSDEETVIEWGERLETIDDLMDDIRDRLEDS